MIRVLFLSIASAVVLTAANDTVTVDTSKKHNKVHRDSGIEYTHGNGNNEDGFVEVSAGDTITWKCPNTLCQAGTFVITTHGYACNPFNYSDSYTINCKVVPAATGGQTCDYGGGKRLCIKYDFSFTDLKGTAWIDDPEVIIDGQNFYKKDARRQRVRAH